MQLKQVNQIAKNKIKQIFDSKAARITQIVLVVVVGVLVLFDIYWYATGTKTISEVIRENSTKEGLFVITWIWGILTAHLFFARKKVDIENKKIPEIIAILLLVIISVLIFLLGTFIDQETILPQYMHIILLAFGGICGYFLWPQPLKEIEDSQLL